MSIGCCSHISNPLDRFIICILTPGRDDDLANLEYEIIRSGITSEEVSRATRQQEHAMKMWMDLCMWEEVGFYCEALICLRRLHHKVCMLRRG